MQTLTEIPFQLDIESLLNRLHVDPETEDAQACAALVHKARKIGKPKAFYKEAFIESKGDDTVSIDGVTFTSKVLRLNLDQVERVFPYIATCGTELDAINIAPGDFLQGFWLDTIKADLLNSGICYVQELLERKYRLGKTSAMSPGSGDINIWPIEQQRQLFALGGDVEGSIGVRLTDSFLMVPNKSVSGIRFATESNFQSCQLCHRENCAGRRALFDNKLWESIQND